MKGTGDYISRETVKQIIAAQCGECADACLEFDGIQPDCNQCLLYGAKKAIESVPAADVVEVVRCKDCMYCQKDELGRWCFNDYENELRDHDFCSHGKRKESKT